MHVYAHRGASIEKPENTLAAFARSLELGAEGIELDVVVSKDGQLMVLHDLTLDRTTNATGPASDFTAAELRQVDAGGGEYVPTLTEVFTLCEQKVRINVEIKDPTAVDSLVALVVQHPNLDWFATSSHWDALENLRAALPDAEVMPLTVGAPENVERHLEWARERYTPDELELWLEQRRRQTFQNAITWANGNGAIGISIFHENISAEIIGQIHDAGLEAWVWTVNDPGRAMEVTAMGADAICTDDPAAVLAARSALTS